MRRDSSGRVSRRSARSVKICLGPSVRPVASSMFSAMDPMDVLPATYTGVDTR